MGSAFSEDLRLKGAGERQCSCRGPVGVVKALVLNLPAEALHLCDGKKLTTHPPKDDCEN